MPSCERPGGCLEPEACGEGACLMPTNPTTSGLYGSFVGRSSPVTGDEENSVTDIIGYAMDRVADELLDTGQTLGLLRFAIDAIEARDSRIAGLERMLP